MAHYLQQNKNVNNYGFSSVTIIGRHPQEDGHGLIDEV